MAENILIPIYDLTQKTSRYSCRRILEHTQYLSREGINQLQNDNLRALIRHAYQTVPYYNREFKERRLRPDDIAKVEDLRKLPVLTKDDIRRNFEDLISRDFPINRLIPYRTGGTGSPLRFFVTKSKISWEVAAEYRAYSWAGYKFGDRCFMFWGSPIDLSMRISQHERILRKIARSFERIVVVDPWVLSETVLEKFAYMLRNFKPRIIRGYAGPVYIMARYLLENKIYDVRPKAVITSAETLYKSMRTVIENAFGSPVFDYYGSREAGAIASECEEHSGYHISAENHVLEFVKEGENVSHDETGEILITGLRNYGMPLIRYQIGDVGKPSNEFCACGRGLPLMKSIEGRASQLFRVLDKSSGKIIPLDASVLMDYLIIHLKSNLEGFRIIQESLDRVVVQVVKREGRLTNDSSFLIEQLGKYLGGEVQIIVEEVDFLPPLPSGKRSPLISKIDDFSQ